KEWLLMGTALAFFLFYEGSNLFFAYKWMPKIVYHIQKYSLQGTTQGNGLAGADMPVRFSM
ncbi:MULTISPECIES: hypothetical protein, partial [unclassified Neglectibacter]|uniref:hypothetical protein n=1 Tax=unclassified Neglectibacter TaxID=2632164 RepID=UPI001A9ACFE1